MAGNRWRPATIELENRKLSTKKGMVFYRGCIQNQTPPAPNGCHTKHRPCLSCICITKSLGTDVAAAVFEMNDWLCRLSRSLPAIRSAKIPQRMGGFRSLWQNGHSNRMKSLLALKPGFILKSLCRTPARSPDSLKTLDRYAKFKGADRLECNSISYGTAVC